MVDAHIRALLIEDNPSDAFLLQETLDTCNVEIHWVERLSDGLTKLAAESFGVVLLDLSLPDSKDLDSLKKIRHAFPHIPIVILTGLDDRAFAIEAVKSGAQDYLVKGKPSAESMVRCMRYAMERQLSKELVKRSAAEAREAQAKLELALAASHIGVYSWDIESNIFSRDARVNEICGLEADVNDLNQVQQCLVEEDRQKVYAAIQESLNGIAEYDIEFRVRTNDGTIRQISSKGKTFYDGSGKPTRLTGVLRDITKEVATQEHERRLALLEQREEFIAMLAHDLRTPIYGAQRLISFMIGGTLGVLQPAYVDILSRISASNKILLQSIGNILEVYRFEAGCDKPTLKANDLSSIFRSCEQELEPIAQSNEITLKWSSSAGPVLADSMALSRVIMNLASNAVKFSMKGGCVEIIATERDGEAVIQVIDNGIGIDASNIEHIFERFYQSSDSHRGNGIGLGLYLCRRLIEAQNGSINCKSALNIGTTFEITLPLATSLTEDHDTDISFARKAKPNQCSDTAPVELIVEVN